MRLLLVAVFGSLIFGCSPDPVVSLRSVSKPTGHPIVHGTRNPQSLTLTGGQKLAIGFLADATGESYCTATLIAPRAAVTASHCVEYSAPSDIFLGVGGALNAGATLLPVMDTRMHPDLDFAVLVLGLDVGAEHPEIQFLEMNREPLTQQWLGEWGDAAGFGETYTPETGLFFARVQVVGLDHEVITVDGLGLQGLCFGDSGAPLLWQRDSNSPPRILGTEHWGDPSCVDKDYITRMDIVAEWVDAILAAPPGPVLQACEGPSEESSCEEGVRLWCSGGYQHTEDCGAEGRVCGWRGEELGFACLPVSCGEVDFLGQCRGDVLEWGGARGFRAKDCADEGLQCVWGDRHQGYNCGGCTRCEGECVDIGESTNHCGGCGQACAPPHATGACKHAVCTINQCAEGFIDSDGRVENGCELRSSRAKAKGPLRGCNASPAVMPGWLYLLGWWGAMKWRRKRDSNPR
ncbi:MAG: trypsin-like serine protease [Myxococcota bacterium]|nr:trypsin-like serine protease [Myxococcota bacterium]